MKARGVLLGVFLQVRDKTKNFQIIVQVFNEHSTQILNFQKKMGGFNGTIINSV